MHTLPDKPEAHIPTQLPYNKPLPDSGQSDLSSIGPSQSASQNTHNTLDNTAYTLHIPPAHSISDHVFPNGSAPLAQVDERGGSSDDDSECGRRVSFSDDIVSDVWTRPYTPKDLCSKLYYSSDETAR